MNDAAAAALHAGGVVVARQVYQLTGPSDSISHSQRLLQLGEAPGVTLVAAQFRPTSP